MSMTLSMISKKVENSATKMLIMEKTIHGKCLSSGACSWAGAAVFEAFVGNNKKKSFYR